MRDRGRGGGRGRERGGGGGGRRGEGGGGWCVGGGDNCFDKIQPFLSIYLPDTAICLVHEGVCVSVQSLICEVIINCPVSPSFISRAGRVKKTMGIKGKYRHLHSPAVTPRGGGGGAREEGQMERWEIIN